MEQATVRQATPKPYAKPTITKHMAASQIVGSNTTCGYYISSSGGGCSASGTYCYYH
jgi:hypothetical protein